MIVGFALWATPRGAGRTSAMSHTITYRLNALLTHAVTVLAVMCALAAITGASPSPTISRFRPTRSLVHPRSLGAPLTAPTPPSRPPVPQTSFTSRTPPWTPRSSRSSASRASTPTTRRTSPSPGRGPPLVFQLEHQADLPLHRGGVRIPVRLALGGERVGPHRRAQGDRAAADPRRAQQVQDDGPRREPSRPRGDLLAAMDPMPHVGRITGDAFEFQNFTFPEEYLSEPETTKYGRHRARRAPEPRRERSEGAGGDEKNAEAPRSSTAAGGSATREPPNVVGEL